MISEKFVTNGASRNVTIHDSNEHWDTVEENQKPKII